MFDPRVGPKRFITSLKNLFDPTRGSNTSRITNSLPLFYLLNHTLNFQNWRLICVLVLEGDLIERHPYLMSEYSNLKNELIKYGPFAKYFKWIDSQLVTNLIYGGWVVIENANFCSSSVLDRLNGLFEDGGYLELYEQGQLQDDKSRKIIPHPDFRIFFALNPKNGELSPAMRNRCVEIFIQYPNFNYGEILPRIIGRELSDALINNQTNKINIYEIGKCFKEALYNGYSFQESFNLISVLLDNDISISREEKKKELNSLVINMRELTEYPEISYPRIQLNLLKNQVNYLDVILNLFFSYSTESDFETRKFLLVKHLNLSEALVDGLFNLRFNKYPLDCRFLNNSNQEDFNNVNAILTTKKLFILQFLIQSINIRKEYPSDFTKLINKTRKLLTKIINKYLKVENELNNEEWMNYTRLNQLVINLINGLNDANYNTDYKKKLIHMTFKKIQTRCKSMNIDLIDEVKDESIFSFEDNTLLEHYRRLLIKLGIPQGFINPNNLTLFLCEMEKARENYKFEILNEIPKDLNAQLELLELLIVNDHHYSNNYDNELISEKNSFFSQFSVRNEPKNKIQIRCHLKVDKLACSQISLNQITDELLYPSENIPIRDMESRISQLDTLKTTLLSDIVLNSSECNYRKLFESKIAELINLFTNNHPASNLTDSVNLLKSDLSSLEIGDVLKEIIKEGLQIAELLLKSEDFNLKLYGKFLTLYGFIKFILSSKLGILDKAEEKVLEKSITDELSKHTEESIRGYQVTQTLSSSHFPDDLNFIHVHGSYLQKHRKLLTEKSQKLSENIPLRNEIYESLYQDVRRMNSSFGSPKFLTEIFTEIFNNGNPQEEKIENWKNSMLRFIEWIPVKYPSYPDIYVPLLDSIADMMEGVALSISVIDDIYPYTELTDKLKVFELNREPYQEKSQINEEELIICNYADLKLDNFDIYDGIISSASTAEEKEKISNRLRNVNREMTDENILSYFKTNHRDVIAQIPKILDLRHLSPGLNLHYSVSAELLSRFKGDDEIKRVIPLIRQKIENCRKLLENYPDNPLLNDAVEIAERMLNFPLKTPLDKFRDGLPMLASKIKTWNDNAPKMYKITLEEIDKLIFNWQKMELSELDLKLKSVVKEHASENTDLNSLWNLIKSPQKNIKKFTKAIFRFLYGSTCGNFEKRFKSLEEFIAILIIKYPHVENLTSPVLFYFRRYREKINLKIADKLKEYKDKAQATLKMKYLSQKDIQAAGYEAVKKELFELLNEASAVRYFNPENDVFPNIILKEKQPPTIIKIRETDYQNDLEFNYGNFTEMTDKTAKILNSISRNNELINFEDDLRERIRDMDSINPDKYIRDTKSGFHKYSKIMSEILKYCQTDLGLSYRNGLLYNLNFLDFASRSRIKLDDNVVANVIKLDKLKESLFIPKKHLTLNFINRFEGISTQGLNYVQANQTILNQNAELINEMNLYLNKISTDLKHGNFDAWKKNFTDFLSRFKLTLYQTKILCNIIIQGRKIKLGCIDEEWNRRDRVSASNVLNFADKHAHLSENLLNTRDEQSFTDKITELSQLSLQETSLSPKLKKIFHNLITQQQLLRLKVDDYNRHKTPSSTHIKISEKLKKKIHETCSLIFLTVQNFKLKNENPEIKISNCVEFHLLKKLQIPKILNAVKHIYRYLTLSRAPSEINYTLSIYPLIRAYVDFSSDILNRNRETNSLLNKFAEKIISICIDFSEAEFQKSDEREEENDDKLGEGCGLGDGTGNENVSNEIENQDELETAMDEKERQKEDDP